MMTPTDIAQHNATLATLTAEDGILRLTWEQHGAVFRRPESASLSVGQQVAAWDSATPGTIVAVFANAYDVTFPDLSAEGGPARYSAVHLRPWPLT